MIVYRRLAAASGCVIDLARAKAHCRVDDDDHDHDRVLSGLVAAVEADAIAVTGHALLTETWQALADGADATGAIVIDRGPFPVVSTVEVLCAGSYVTVDVANWVSRPLSDDRLLIRPKAAAVGGPGNWGAVDTDEAAFRLTFTRGYGATASAVPAPIAAAMLLVLGDLFTNRDASRQANIVENPAAKALLSPFRAANL